MAGSAVNYADRQFLWAMLDALNDIIRATNEDGIKQHGKPVTQLEAVRIIATGAKDALRRRLNLDSRR